MFLGEIKCETLMKLIKNNSKLQVLYLSVMLGHYRRHSDLVKDLQASAIRVNQCLEFFYEDDSLLCTENDIYILYP